MTRNLTCFSALLFVSSFCMAGFGLAQTQGKPETRPTATSADKPELQQFQKIEDAWSTAVNDRDQYGMELVLSPLLVDVSASGDVTTRNQQVASILAGDDKVLRLDQRVITVRTLGDIVVVNGTYTLHHKAANGPVDERGVFTHVFQRTHGGWLCINSQRTLLREDTKAKPKKQSNAELPFHIPLFSKGDKNQQ